MQTTSIKTLQRLVARTPRPLQPLRNLAARAVGDRAKSPMGDAANAELARELLQELEDEQPTSPLLLHMATGFPSALLCVLAAGLLAGALAGREVSAPLAPAAVTAPVQAPVAVAAAAMAGRHAMLLDLETQALWPASPVGQVTIGHGTGRTPAR